MPHVLGSVTDLVHITDKVSDAGFSQPEPEDAETEGEDKFDTAASAAADTAPAA